MDSKKIITGTLAGGITYFLLGWVIYGMLMKDYMASNYNNCAMKSEDQMIWWALIVSNFTSALFIALVLSWRNMSGFGAGLKTAAILGFLICLSWDLSFYSMSTMFYGGRVMAVDILVGTVFFALGGGVIGAVMGMGDKPAGS